MSNGNVGGVSKRVARRSQAARAIPLAMYSRHTQAQRTPTRYGTGPLRAARRNYAAGRWAATDTMSPPHPPLLSRPLAGRSQRVHPAARAAPARSCSRRQQLCHLQYEGLTRITPKFMTQIVGLLQPAGTKSWAKTLFGKSPTEKVTPSLATHRPQEIRSTNSAKYYRTV